MLGERDMVAFIATADADRARSFYEGVLGLEFVEDSPFALVFKTHGAGTLRIQKVPSFEPQRFTALGWRVPDIRETAGELAAKGVALERFEGLPHDDLGIWTAPGGTRVGWFKDPDGNLLSLQSD